MLVARWAAQAHRPGAVINIGFGISDYGRAGDTRLDHGTLRVVGGGRVSKFRPAVEHLTFSGPERWPAVSPCSP
jgi:acyl CoA:acetate/3-ketoacid CoA transferase